MSEIESSTRGKIQSYFKNNFEKHKICEVQRQYTGQTSELIKTINSQQRTTDTTIKYEIEVKVKQLGKFRMIEFLFDMARNFKNLLSSKKAQTILNIRIGLAFLILLLSSPSMSQQGNFQLGSLPSFNLNKKLNNGYRVNIKVESRQVNYAASQFDPSYDRTNLSMVLSKRVGLSSNLAGGYLTRIDDSDLIHRFIQQFTALIN